MRTKEAQREYQRQWIANRRAAFFEGKVCVKCGSTDQLELDHIDPRAKVHHAIWTWAEDRRLAELAKCQVLCKVCHKAKTKEQLPITNGYKAHRHGTRSMYYVQKCKCGLCLLWERNRKRRLRAAR